MWDGHKLTFKDLTCVSSDKVLLWKAVGTVKKGTITAVLGPSSGGKSVLLKLLAGRGGSDLSNISYSGQIAVDAKAVAAASKPAAYVPQESDTLLGVLTVREAISYSLRLKNPAGIDVNARRARVDDIIVKLGLDSCADTKIGTFYMAGVSGGQKRRACAPTQFHLPPILPSPTACVRVGPCLRVHPLRLCTICPHPTG